MKHGKLWESSGLALIIESSTGVSYSNQTGGYSCLQPEIEGAVVPLRNDTELGSGRFLSPENELFQYFEGPAHRGTGAVRGLSTADADFIDSVLEQYRLLPQIQVDRSRLQESHEAWVFVLVSEEPPGPTEPLYAGFCPYPARAVLTWSNTD